MPGHHDRARDAQSAVRAAAALRRGISDGRHRPGDKLGEHRVSEALGISRNTLREVFAALEAEGLVAREPHRGVRVAHPGPEDVRDIYRTRRLLEPAAVLWGDLAPAALDELAAIAQQALVATDERTTADANQRFHRTLVSLGGSRTLDAAMDRVLARMRLVFAQMTTVGDFHARFVPRNVALVAMLGRGEREGAARELRAYLDAAEAELIAHLEAARSA